MLRDMLEKGVFKNHMKTLISVRKTSSMTNERGRRRRGKSIASVGLAVWRSS